MIKRAKSTIIIFILSAILYAGVCSCFSAPYLHGDEPAGGQWKTIIVGSGEAIQLVPLPNASAQNAEIQGLLKLQDHRTSEIVKMIEFWDVGATVR